MGRQTLYGAEAGDWFSRLSTGDADGDGIDDILVNASSANSVGNSRTDAGEIYLITGKTSWPSSLDMAAGDYRCVFYGAEAYDWMDVSAIGDVTDNGSADLIVGVVMADGPGNSRLNCGDIYVIPWSASLPSSIDLLSYTPLLYIYAPLAHDSMGVYSTCLVGDPDNNGRPNIIVGAAKSSRLGRAGNGQVFILNYPSELVVGENAGEPSSFTLTPRPGGFLLILPQGYAGNVSLYDASGRGIAWALARDRWELGSLVPGVYLVIVEGLGTGKVAVQ